MSNKLKFPVNENDHHQNSLSAPVILLEYGDFECPYCAVAAPMISKLLKEYRRDVCFVYRHYPLKGIHPYAEVAAIASEAANQQDKFWEMHEYLFINQEHLSNENIDKIAQAIGLDVGLFQQDLGRYDLLEKVRSDQHGANLSGVQSTPTLFINGFQYEGATSYWSLREAVEIELSGLKSATL